MSVPQPSDATPAALLRGPRRIVVAIAGLLAGLFNLRANLQAFQEGLRFLVSQRHLIVTLARREVSVRYAGQAFGMLWSIGHPLFQMLVMVFVFNIVLPTKTGGTPDMPRDYTLYILSGLAGWLTMSASLGASTVSVSGSAGLIKQFGYDARLFPPKEVVVSLIAGAVSIGVVLLYTLVRYQTLFWTTLLLPLVVGVHILLAIGWGWLLASIAVFVRDVREVVTLALTLTIYLLPVVYLPSWVPDVLRPILYVNPFSYLIWMYQDVLYFGAIEHPVSWVVSGLLALFMFAGGYRTFRRLSAMFGEAL